MRVYAHYGLPGGERIAQEALERDYGDVRITAAIADLFDASGHPKKAVQALDSAWTEFPGNGILRRARLQRDLAVDL